jgi:hypothetical protein
LDGQVINPGGSMTGGSVNKEAGILSRANELEKLSAQEKELENKKLALEAELQEAQRAVDQVEFQMTAAADQLRDAEDRVLTLDGKVKQHEILLQAICEARDSAQRELDALEERSRGDRDRFAAQQAKIQVFAAQLEATRQNIAALEDSQTEASEATAKITQRMTERTVKYQVGVTGKNIVRHTPLDRQKVYLYGPLLNEINARVLADAYHEDFLRFADTEDVTFWQSIDDPDQLKVEPMMMNADGSVSARQAQTIAGLVGVIFDEEALGYTVIHNWSATTPFNAKGGYWNVFHNFTERYWNDFTEKGVVLLMD